MSNSQLVPIGTYFDGCLREVECGGHLASSGAGNVVLLPELCFEQILLLLAEGSPVPPHPVHHTVVTVSPRHTPHWVSPSPDRRS